jgi:hypothetical protein
MMGRQNDPPLALGRKRHGAEILLKVHVNFDQRPHQPRHQQTVATEMGDRNYRKRTRDPVQSEQKDEAPVKRRRQISEEQIKLSKLYDDLAAESDDVRFDAAKELILKFSPGNQPAAKDVETALGRLIKGLCSQRKAARVGFSLTLTELLREILGQREITIKGLDLDVASLIKLVEEKTKVEGNVPGRVSAAIAIRILMTYIP